MKEFIEIIESNLKGHIKVDHNKHYKVTFSKDITISGKDEVITMSSSPSDPYAVKQAFRDCRRKIKDTSFNSEMFDGTEYSGMFSKNKKSKIKPK